ncbi:MAG: fibronectin type III domain-containing protein, partial [Planctomycetota bacterium]
GWEHSLALKQDSSIVGWGMDLWGQATPPAGSDYVAIAAGGSHCLALKQDGSIIGWGYNWDGQATPPAGSVYVAIATGGAHCIALKQDGSIVGWGDRMALLSAGATTIMAKLNHRLATTM